MSCGCSSGMGYGGHSVSGNLTSGQIVSGQIQCCVIALPVGVALGAIVDYQYDNTSSVSRALLEATPNAHSVALGAAISGGFSYDVASNLLYLPPGVKAGNIATWTVSATRDACGAYIWTATPICATVQCGNCADIL